MHFRTHNLPTLMLPHTQSTLVISSEGFHYYLNFVNACTNYNWIFLMVTKAEVYNLFIWSRYWQKKTQCGTSIKKLQSNNELEFLRLTPILQSHGIVHHRSCPYSHQSMGTVEQCH